MVVGSVIIIHAYLFCYVYMYVSTLLVSDVFQLYITAYFPSLFFKNRGFFFELLICINSSFLGTLGSLGIVVKCLKRILRFINIKSLIL